MSNVNYNKDSIQRDLYPSKNAFLDTKTLICPICDALCDAAEHEGLTLDDKCPTCGRRRLEEVE